MEISYKRLWKLLIDKNMKKKDLETAAGINHYTVSKLNRGENVTLIYPYAEKVSLDKIIEFHSQSERNSLTYSM